MKKLCIAVSILGVICIGFFLSALVYFLPGKRLHMQTHKDTSFMAFEYQFPTVKKNVWYGGQYGVEYHAQMGESEIVLARNSYGTTYFACEGSQLESSPAIVITPAEFEQLIQSESICTPGIYQAWQIEE